jgi:hypothetical protein
MPCQHLKSKSLDRPLKSKSCAPIPAFHVMAFASKMEKAIQTSRECKWAVKTSMCTYFSEGRCESGEVILAPTSLRVCSRNLLPHSCFNLVREFACQSGLFSISPGIRCFNSAGIPRQDFKQDSEQNGCGRVIKLGWHGRLPIIQGANEVSSARSRTMWTSYGRRSRRSSW